MFAVLHELRHLYQILHCENKLDYEKEELKNKWSKSTIQKIEKIKKTM